MEQVKLINRKLFEYFGPAPNSDNVALFRIVWPEGLIEKRFGVFEKHCNGIFMGEETGVREVRKYSWVKERWILEVYKASNILSSDIIKSGDGYEPIWIFRDKEGNYQPLWWPAIEKLCKDWIANFIHPERKNEVIVTNEEEARINNEAAKIEESLDLSPLQLAFRRGVDEAIIMPGKVIDWER